MAIQSTRVPRGDVTATISFYAPPADGSIPYNLVRDPKPGEAVRNFGDDFQQILIRDVRGSEDSLTLDHDSVKVVRNLPPSTEQDFTDDASIKANFYPEVEDLLLKNVPGSSKVVIFDHTIRRADPNASRNPVLKAHIDQTLKAAEARVRRHLPEDEAEERLKGRYRIINVWRPLVPVGLCFLCLREGRRRNPRSAHLRDFYRRDGLYRLSPRPTVAVPQRHDWGRAPPPAVFR